MADLLWLVPALPLLGFVLLTFARFRGPKSGAAAIGVGSVTASFAASIVALLTLHRPVTRHLWTWLSVDGFRASFSLHCDSLTLVMMLVVTGVGSLIHLYAARYMRGDDGYRRFFAWMNLFVASMLILVMAADLLLLYLGWELVGLCSYLLIGFWYSDPANGHAARKAFVVTRVGDVALALGLFAIVASFGTLSIGPVLHDMQTHWVTSSGIATAVALAFLIGAMGKSAQLPLQVWLPDAMAGPTPVSALIHAATMVTAGVYLIARMYPLFQLAPAILEVVAIVGAATLVVAGLAALGQRDIKRVLAYSTISQIGYMFLALGVGAPIAALFHLVTHACFKALLFLGAGAVIHAMDGEHDILKMGGLRRPLPVTFWTFLVGAASLSGLPLITAGYYSKDLIVASAWSTTHGSVWLWGAGLLGAFVTGLYAFRLVFRVFFGPGPASEPDPSQVGSAMKFAMIALASLAVATGALWPASVAHFAPLRDFLTSTIPRATHSAPPLSETVLDVIAGVTSLAAIGAAWLLYGWRGGAARMWQHLRGSQLVRRAAAQGWYFDAVYDFLFVRPFVFLARLNRDDFVDLVFDGVEHASEDAFATLRATQTGNVRLYLSVVFVSVAAVLLVAGIATGVWP